MWFLKIAPAGASVIIQRIRNLDRGSLELLYSGPVDQGPKLQASSTKPQAPSLEKYKRQASSPKQQASSFKPQAASSLIREPRYME